MAKGPRGEKRPGDVVGAAVKSMRILTGEEAEDVSSAKQTRAHKAGKAGGKARAATLSPEEREEIARVAAEARWKKRK
jgi:hypothetical protein